MDSQRLNGRIVSFVNFGTGTGIDLSGEYSRWKGALDLYNGSTGDNTKITGWQYQSFGGDQAWYIHPVGEFPANGAVVKIQNYGANTLVDLLNGSGSNGTPIVGWQGNIHSLNPHQLWVLKFT
ncbi:hypothetical protein FGRMN_7135 [Fusarium graminum]|nr:hypothetical protein FGRMN_7135 [Fusarium graminum]